MSRRPAEGLERVPAHLHRLQGVLLERGIDRVVPFDIATRTRFRGISSRHGLLLHGAAGWSEFSPFDEYPPAAARRWLDAALEAATEPLPKALRRIIPVNVTVPAVGPDEAARLVSESAAQTVKVKVAEPGQGAGEDVERVAAVRSALGVDGAIRVDANAAWDVTSACARLPELEAAARGLEYVEQPCAGLDDVAEVRRRTGIRVAVDETLRLQRIDDPEVIRTACDVVILKAQPLGGVRPALALAARIGLPAVVSSALESSVGLAVGVRLAAALPELPYACGLDTARLLATDVTTSLVSQDGVHDVAEADSILRRGPDGSDGYRGSRSPQAAFDPAAAVEDALWRRFAQIVDSS